MSDFAPDMNAMAGPEDILLLCLDVDGVLTDGTIAIDDRGVETKKFNVRDGAGINIWQRLGYHVAIITGRSGMAVTHRARELGIDVVFQGCKDKRAAFVAALNTYGCSASQATVIGDDLPDLSILSLCGYPITVADAVKEVRDVAQFVTVRPGGQGAVREAVEHLLRARGEWDAAVEYYAGG